MSGPADPLLAWFRSHQRVLPWRGPFPREPYPVLVSELMLQQTQVQRVLPLYAQFVQRFPSLPQLAAASEEEVVAAWSGLGYYRRARALHAAARAIAEAGAWPSTQGELQRLPGFGPYTAAAVAAFAFGGGDPPIDGNLLRVAARVLALDAPMGSRVLHRAADGWARQLFDRTPTPEIWEALMELGARLCRPTAPSCFTCPLAPSCAGHCQGEPRRFPTPRARRRREAHRWVALWLTDRTGRVLLQQRPPGSVLGGLWVPPLRELGIGEEAFAAAAAVVRALGLQARLRPAPPFAHSITFRHITVFPFVGVLRADTVAEASQSLWVTPEAPALATSTLTHKLRLAVQHPHTP